MRIVSFLLAFVLASQAFAGTVTKEKFKESRTWQEFEQEIQELEESDRKDGLSYLLSGSLVVVGGITGYQTTNDTAVKFVFGILQGLGVGAIGLGLNKLNGDHDYNSFYQSLRSTDLTAEQRDQMVRTYLEHERARKETERKISVATNILAGLLDIYAATRESDSSSKAAFYFLAGIHAALAVSYSF